MDDLPPYEFLERIFTKLNPSFIQVECRPQFVSPLWNEVIRIFQYKIELMELTLVASADELSYCFSTRPYANEEISYSFDEVRQFDPRFKRVCRFVIDHTDSSLVWGGHQRYSLNAEQLPEMIELICRHQLTDVAVNLDDAFSDLRKQITTEFEKHIINMELERLELEYSAESMNFLKICLQQDSLASLAMSGKWPHDLKEDLLAFVQRPQFTTLRSRETQLFDIEDIRRIIAQRKSVQNPGHHSAITIRTDSDFSDVFASWELIEVYNGTRTYEEHHNQLRMNVRCASDYLLLSFDE